MRGVRSFIPSRTHDFAALTSAPAVTLSTTPILYVTLLGGAARPLAGTIAPSRSEPRATGCCLAGADLAVGRSRGGAEMGRVLAGQAGPPPLGTLRGARSKHALRTPSAGKRISDRSPHLLSITVLGRFLVVSTLAVAA
jgi:hypothetical protein